MSDLGRLIRKERERRGMRGTDLGVAIGRDAAYISRLENGLLKEVPDPSTLGKLADALGVSVRRLLEAIGYALTEERTQSQDIGPDRSALIEIIERDLTESDARVLMMTARGIVEERDARTVSAAEEYALGVVNSARQQPDSTT